MINNRREIGGSIQLNRLKALMVRVENPLHAVTVRVLNVAVLKKAKSTGNSEEVRMWSNILILD